MKILIADHRSILANTDWKKLWMETGQLMNRIDNNVIDSSDSTLPEDPEVTDMPQLLDRINTTTTFLNILPTSFQITSQNLTVQLGGTAFLVCKVPGVDRVGVNWVSFKTFCQARVCAWEKLSSANESSNLPH